MIDLASRHLEIVKHILGAHVPEVEVRVFGSRVNSKSCKYSDLDLALVAAEKISLDRIESLKCAFAESDLPFQVDVLDWHSLSPEFRKVIEKGYEVLQEGSKKSGVSGAIQTGQEFRCHWLIRPDTDSSGEAQ